MVVLEDSSLPLYVQIYQQLKNIIIETDRIPPGCRLPSSRHFSRVLGVSRNTVETAYQQLYAEGYIDSKPRQGFFAVEFDKSRLVKAGAADQSIVRRQAVTPPKETFVYDLRHRQVDLSKFPFALWNKLISQSINDYKECLKMYGHPQGEYGLRAMIAGYLVQYRGISCLPERIVICAGTQHALTVICQLLKGRFSLMAMENPGNYGARIVFQNNDLSIAPIPLEQDGVSVEKLHESAAGAIYVTPSRQFPSGVVMSVAKRAKLLEWADKTGAIIIEDDFNAYFRYSTRPIPALQGMSKSDKVIYLGSFAQAMLPTVRVSYIVLPEWLVTEFNRRLWHYDSTVSVIFQKALEIFMAKGHFEHHLRRMNQLYKKKQEILVKAVEETMGDFVELKSTNAGLHILLTLKDNSMSEEELLGKAAQAGVAISPTAPHWLDKPAGGKAEILLSFGGIEQEAIRPAVEILSKVWR